MSFLTTAKQKFKKEVEDYKTNKRLENDPEVVRYKLEKAREEKRQEGARVREQLQLERDKQELKQLKQGNSKLGGFLSSTQSYLQGVKQRQQINTGNTKREVKAGATLGSGRNVIYDQSPRSSFVMDGLGKESVKNRLLSNEKSRSNVFGHSGGVYGQPTVVKQKKAKGQTIVIKLK